MNNWKMKLFGDNRMNLYGWIAAGTLSIVASIFAVVVALKFLDSKYAVFLLLLAIWVPVLGLFGLALQNYCARVAKSLEDEDKRKEKDHVA